MTVSIAVDRLKAMMRIVGKAIPSRTTMSILQCVGFDTDNGYLTLLGSDMEVGVSIKSKVKVDGETVSAAIPYKQLYDWLSTLNDLDYVDIEPRTKPYEVVFSSVGASVTYRTLPLDEMPIVASNPPEFCASVSVDKEVIGMAVMAASTDMAQPVLSGVCFDLEAESLKLKSADGFRGTIAYCQGVEDKRAKKQVIAPAKAISKFTFLAKDNMRFLIPLEDVAGPALYLEVLETGITGWVTIQAIYGMFPDIERVIPAKSIGSIRPDYEKFEKALARAMSIARYGSNLCTLQIESKEQPMQISSYQLQEGQAHSDVSYDVVDALLQLPLTIGFNGQYMLDIVKRTRSAVLSFAGPNSPMLFEDYVGEDEIRVEHVVMPMHLGGK